MDWQPVKTVDPRYAATTHLVEATGYEILCLWQEWHKDVAWVQDAFGASAKIGKFGGMPLVVSLFWNTVNGRLICFYEQISMVTHSERTEAWLRTAFPNVPITNAMNFANAVKP